MDAQRQSYIIDSLRFPLMLLVVFIHVPINTAEVPLWEYSLADGQAVFIYISRLISYVVGAAAVPCFFVFSGYYTFAKNPNKWLVPSDYKRELMKKARTLLLPYLLWNLLMFVSIWVKDSLVGVFNGVNPVDLISITPPHCWDDILLRVFWGGPINMPLWYVRDLLVLLLVAPLVYVAVKRSSYIVPLLFLLALWCNPPFVLSAAYFSLGALFAIRKVQLISVAERYFSPLMWIAIPLNLIFPFIAHSPLYSPYINIPNTLLLVFCIIGLGTYVYDHKRVYSERLLRLNTFVFFIYVAHEVFILATIKGILARLGLWQYGWGGVVGYFVCGVATTLICIVVYGFLQRFLPRLLAWSLGGR